MRSIPQKFRPILLAAALASLAGGAYFALDVFDIGEQDVGDCCATEWDPTPYQQVPAEPAP